MNGLSSEDKFNHEGFDGLNQNILPNVARESKSPSRECDVPTDALQEIGRISASIAFVIKSVESLSQNDVDMEMVLNDIEGKEKCLFSPIPDYLVKEWKQRKTERVDLYKGVAKIDTVAVFDESGNGRINYLDKCRIVVDPKVPLRMPFSKQRFDATDNLKKNVQGNYHRLFFDDGEPVIFAPPEGNKRQKVAEAAEEVAMWKRKLYRPKRHDVEKPVKKILKVTNDFVPLCAQVDVSAAREGLLQKQEHAKLSAGNRRPFVSK